MEPRYGDAQWLTEDLRFSLAELVELSGVPEAEVRELVYYGSIAPVDADSTQWTFTGKCLLTVRTASRLRTGLDLEPHGVALVLSLLERIEALEAQLGGLRARTPRHTR